MSNVVIAVVLKSQEFPAGTVDSQYLFEILKDGVAVFSQEADKADAVTFAVVDVGAYVARVTKNGVSASAPFSIAAPANVTLQVPDTVAASVS